MTLEIMDKTRFNTVQEELDYWAKIETAGRNGTGVPDHDCKIEGGCRVEQDYAESRAWWIEEKSKKENEKLL